MRNGPSHLLSDEELAELRWAYQHLEHPSLAARLTSRLATPIEEGLNLLPKSWRKRLDKAAETSVCVSLRLAVRSLTKLDAAGANTWLPKFAAAGAGAGTGLLLDGLQLRVGDLPGDVLAEGLEQTFVLDDRAYREQAARDFWRRTMEDLEQKKNDLRRAVQLLETTGALHATVERARLYEENEHHARELEVLNRRLKLRVENTERQSRATQSIANQRQESMKDVDGCDKPR